MRGTGVAAGAATGLLLAWTAPARALASTNLELVTEAAARAVDQAVAGLDVGAGGRADDPVLVLAEANHGGNWLVEHLLVEELLGRGLAVTLDSASVDGAAPRLSYRLVDLGVSGRSGLLGGAVTRRCRVSVRLGYSRDGQRLWSGEGRAEVADRVPKGELDALQDSRYAFAHTELERRTWGRYVEPVIVSAVLGSLVYLFFSHR